MNAEYARSYAQLYRRHWWWRAREEFILAEISRLKLPAAAQILDVGCGDGLFFDQLARFGRVDGVEISREVVASPRHQANVFICPFDASFDPAQRYDLVLMLDILEHLERPRQALERALGLLRPGGRVMITVPAFRGLWTGHDELSGHRDRYTRRRFSALAERAGMRIERTGYFFQWLFAAKLLVGLRERLFGGKPAVPKVPPRPLNWLLYQLSRLEGRGLGRLRLPWGSSLLAVGRAASPAAEPKGLRAKPASGRAAARVAGRHDWSEHPGVAAAVSAHA